MSNVIPKIVDPINCIEIEPGLFTQVNYCSCGKSSWDGWHYRSCHIRKSKKGYFVWCQSCKKRSKPMKKLKSAIMHWNERTNNESS